MYLILDSPLVVVRCSVVLAVVPQNPQGCTAPTIMLIA